MVSNVVVGKLAVTANLKARLLAALNISCIHALQHGLISHAVGELWAAQDSFIGCQHDLHGHEAKPSQSLLLHQPSRVP